LHKTGQFPFIDPGDINNVSSSAEKGEENDNEERKIKNKGNYRQNSEENVKDKQQTTNESSHHPIIKPIIH
jgi:hypothetical protein